MGKRAAISPSSMSSFSTIFMHADAVDVVLMALGFVGAVGDGITDPLLFFLSTGLLNDIGNSASSLSDLPGVISKGVVSLLFLACGSFVMSFCEGYCWTRTSERQASRMRARYLKAVMRQDIEFFDLNAGGSGTEVVTCFSSDSLVVQDVIAEKVPNFIANTSHFLGSYAMGFFLTWRLAVATLPTVVLLIVPGLMYGRVLMGLARRVREEYNKAGAIVEQSLSSIRTVYSFAAEGSTVAKFSAALEDSVMLGLKQGLAKGLAIGSNGCVSFAIWSFIIWYGSRLVMYHGVESGTVFFAGGIIINGGLAFGTGLSNLKYFSESSAAGERIIEVIRRVPKIDTESTEGEVLESINGDVEFKMVQFAYPSRPDSFVLRDFNMKVPAGQTVALVGGSGSGKSTVISLLERFYDPVGGEVLLDGVDIRKLKLKWLRSQMGLVSQEPVLFAASIKENILFGKEDATMEEVVAAARVANAHNFISQLPQGYDTQVGERGVQMSGGQKQRIAIARAVLKSPKILLLDEATSALDTESERVVQEALDLASVGRTAIVVAHRLSTIRNADVITVVQYGKVMETGSHDELISDEDSVYSSLVRLQQTKIETEKEASSSMTAILAPHSPQVDGCSMSRGSSAGESSDNGNNNELSEELKPQAPPFRRLLMLNAPEWKQAFAGSLCATLAGATQPVTSFVRSTALAVFFVAGHEEIKSKTRTVAFVLLSVSVFTICIHVGEHYLLSAMGEHLTKRVRERLLSKILTFEVGWFDEDENATGAVCARLALDANAVRSLVGDRIALIIQTTSGVLIAWGMGIILAWRLAAVMIVTQPLVILCFYSRRVVLKRLSGKAMKSQAGNSKIAAEAIANIRTITAYSSQEAILRVLKVAQQGPRRESVYQSWIAGVILALAESLVVCRWAFDFWYGSKIVAEGYISSKGFLQTIMIIGSTGRKIAEAGSMTTDLSQGADAVASVFALLDRCTRIESDDPEGHCPEKLKGGIDLCGVDFAYPARPDVVIFKGFSLSIEAGESMALVGQSGSGKSTIISLIERFYDPLTGTVKIDGRDVKSYNLRWLRKRIGMVGQEPALFAGTIRENISYGREDATAAEVEDAARAANVHQFVCGLKDGYDTQCGDRGVQLSGGQKQRIAIARAILKDPAILLLDEATSALDSQSETVVQEALERLMVGRTSVVVAHRLSTIRNCDVIAVIDKGAVVEKGTHTSLLAKGPKGAYYGLAGHSGRQHFGELEGG